MLAVWGVEVGYAKLGSGDLWNGILKETLLRSDRVERDESS